MMRLTTLVACSMCIVVAGLMVTRQVEGGRLQDFFHNLVSGNGFVSSSSGSGGSGSNNSNSNSNNNNNNNNANSNSNADSNDSDAAATGDAPNDQPVSAPMMSAYIRYPSFYDSFGTGFGGYPGMPFSSPMGAMSALNPMAIMPGGSPGGAFSPTAASFAPTAASFGTFGATHSGNPLGPFSGHSATGGMSASSLNNVFASSAPSLMGGFSPYYGRRRR